MLLTGTCVFWDDKYNSQRGNTGDQHHQHREKDNFEAKDRVLG
jgi:hypothetical protein